MSAADWFGRKLRELREKAGWSRADLASRANVSERAIVQWELAEREPSWSMVLAVADALGVSCEEFRGEAGAGSPFPSPRPRGRPAKAAPASPDEPKANKPLSGPSG